MESLDGISVSSGMDLRPGSMGKPAPGYDVRIVNNMGAEVPRGEQGNIGIRVRPHKPPGLFEGNQNLFCNARIRFQHSVFRLYR